MLSPQWARLCDARLWLKKKGQCEMALPPSSSRRAALPAFRNALCFSQAKWSCAEGQLLIACVSHFANELIIRYILFPGTAKGRFCRVTVGHASPVVLKHGSTRGWGIKITRKGWVEYQAAECGWSTSYGVVT